MKVTVRDHSAESWGHGFTNPRVVTVEIADNCPVCGGKRGEPFGINSCDDGAYYWVQGWRNPCGHLDMYEAVLREAKVLAAQATEEDEPWDECPDQFYAADAEGGAR